VGRGAKIIGIRGDKRGINYTEIENKAFFKKKDSTWRLLSSRM
jgi:hypothetical protein